MKIALGSDHGGFELKDALIKFLTKMRHTVKDFGTHSKESCDYPLIGFEVAKAVSKREYDRGILICKTGVGMVIIANKLHGVRAAACYDIELARSSREHNDCNVLVLAAQYTNVEKACQIVKVWLETPDPVDRHARRVRLIEQFEKGTEKRKKT